MLQRIQSILLLLVAILGIIFPFLPVLGYENPQQAHYLMKAYHTINIKNLSVVFNNIGIGIVGGLIVVITLIVILLYKNRQLQIKLAKLNILLIALQVVVIVFYNKAVINAIGKEANNMITSFKIGSIVPVISLILTYLAIYFIKKDDKLVKWLSLLANFISFIFSFSVNICI